MKGTVLKLCAFVWNNIEWILLTLYQIYVMRLGIWVYAGLMVLVLIHGLRNYGSGLTRGMRMTHRAMYEALCELKTAMSKD